MKNKIILVMVLTVGLNQLCASYRQKMLLSPFTHVKPVNLAQFYFNQRQLEKTEDFKKSKRRLRWRDENSYGAEKLTDERETVSRDNATKERAEREKEINDALRVQDFELLTTVLEALVNLEKVELQRSQASLDKYVQLPVGNSFQRHFLREQLERFSDDKFLNEAIGEHFPTKNPQDIAAKLRAIRTEELPPFRYLRINIGKILSEVEIAKRLNHITQEASQQIIKEALNSEIAQQGLRESLRKSIADPTFKIEKLKAMVDNDFFEEPVEVQEDIQLLIDNSYKHVLQEWQIAQDNFQQTGQELPEIQKYVI